MKKRAKKFVQATSEGCDWQVPALSTARGIGRLGSAGFFMLFGPACPALLPGGDSPGRRGTARLKTGGGGGMPRKCKYTAKGLERAVNRYFGSISRVVPRMEKRETG